jgi:hypothetical protein
MLTAAERYRGSVYKVDPDDIEEMAFCEDSDCFLMCGDGEMTNTDHGAEVQVTPV